MSLTTLNALSPLDGRYQSKLDALRPYFSEYALIKHRAWVEVEWLKALSAALELTEIAPFSADTIKELDEAIANFSEDDASQVKAIEARTNHDVKALEYWLKEKFDGNPEVKKASEFIHFACTSEDINVSKNSLPATRFLAKLTVQSATSMRTYLPTRILTGRVLPNALLSH
mgnify:CR=1 FL=1